MRGKGASIYSLENLFFELISSGELSLKNKNDKDTRKIKCTKNH